MIAGISKIHYNTELYCTHATIDSYMLTIKTSKLWHLHSMPHPSKCLNHELLLQ